MLYSSPPERDDEGETFHRGNYEVMMTKSFPHPKKLGNYHFILAVLHCHILLTAVRVRSGGLN